jgi:hypothetical protein
VPATTLLEGALPPILQDTLTKLPQLQEEASFAVVCQGTHCLPPVHTVVELQSAMKTQH